MSSSSDVQFDFSGRRVVVTGATRGLGLAIAVAFKQSGAEVLSLQRSGTVPRQVAEAQRAGGSSRPHIGDLSDRADVDRLVGEVSESGPVDILVNNAGIQRWHDAVDFPMEDFDLILDVNLRAVLRLCQGFGVGMIERGRGKVVNVASMTSFVGGYRAAAYAASKGGVAQLTKALCNEWASSGVNVNAVAPGYFDTELNDPLKADATRRAEITSRIPAGEWGSPRSVADATLFLSSDRADYIHGVVLPVDGGWLAR